MKKITLEIPDNKVDFALELFKQLGLQITDESEIPDEHKKIVRERIKTSKSEDMISWEKARKTFSFKPES